MSDSRQFVPSLTASLARHDDGRLSLLAPTPGLWCDAPELGALVRPGDSLGTVEILGVHHRLCAPEGALGVVDGRGQDELARRPVDYGAPLLTLDPDALGGELVAATEAGASPGTDEGALVFASPSSGRFYRRPGPDKAMFVELGQILERGQTIGLLEIMKTFTRLNYDDPKLPARAKVVKIVAEDQQDLGAGDVILELERVDT
ncbi:Biotin carboxyl carrier protein of acetyl-CoA carboxylase [Enhygromyxa salina]|uniref:Biotin carboxyl carrier protein of acetyl-CoA carboxylase n=1 Tax=Enhygromyxa salina TaxID=215803 RepID=A0A2S9YJX3_9BACT|nr:biotin/lipoyl-containing protein [Enhygromyxa salina]PRQ05413.1 Biotin carboxyl carrier protein of acetyl-CoA carboxylase [Enhygromyxa salina]